MHLSNSVSILTADDHVIVRTGLQVMLEHKFGITDLYEADSCATALSSLRQHHPSHLILDMHFKDGNSIEILPTIKSLFPQLHILAYSMLPTEIYAPALARLGVPHYLHKESSKEAIVAKLQAFILGADKSTSPRKHQKTENPFTQLSKRELEVLHYWLKGDSTGNTCTALNLQKSTVSTLKGRILEKTGAQHLKALLDLASVYNYNP